MESSIMKQFSLAEDSLDCDSILSNWLSSILSVDNGLADLLEPNDTDAQDPTEDAIDYDNDGDLDLLGALFYRELSENGQFFVDVFETTLYRNESGKYIDSGIQFDRYGNQSE